MTKWHRLRTTLTPLATPFLFREGGRGVRLNKTATPLEAQTQLAKERRRGEGIAHLLFVLLFTLSLCYPRTAAFANPRSPLLKTQEELSAPRISYSVTPILDAKSPRIDVYMILRWEKPPESVEVQMPIWSPGDYHVQNHAQHVQNLCARVSSPQTELDVTHPQPYSWRIWTRGHKEVGISYTIPATPPGYFSENVQILPDQVFLNGPATFLYVVGHKKVPVTLYLTMRPDWESVVALPEHKVPGPEGPDSFRRIEAPNYDTLADSPIVMASSKVLKVESFTVSKKQHRIAFFGHSEQIADTKAYVPVLRRIVTAYEKIMGELPYEQYAFFFDVNGNGGGLEHLNGTRMAIWGGDPKGIGTFAAHEFFHLWNVKRIRPKVLGPFDYINPPKTRNLWWSEGVTDYYAHLCVRRAGLISEENFLAQWAGAIKGYGRLEKRLKVSADESSLRVWEANNSSGYGISYYFKGLLIGLCLDLKIRAVTEGKRSLDDVMRELMRRGNPPKPGFGEDEIREVVNLISGQDLTEFYNTLARKPGEMPFAECLGYVGLNTQGKPLPNATPEQVALRKEWAKSFQKE